LTVPTTAVERSPQRPNGKQALAHSVAPAPLATQFRVGT
jgi:hypothetical protein